MEDYFLNETRIFRQVLENDANQCNDAASLN